MLHFLDPCDPFLSIRAHEVPVGEITSPEIQGLIDQMFAIAKGEREDLQKKVAIGLAAPQIGVSKRIILVDVGVDKDRKKMGELRVYINPQIVWKSNELEEGRESCYSVDHRLSGIVWRPKSIVLNALDRDGKAITQEFTGFTARIFQHEIDHLDGNLFPDRIGKDGILHWVLEEEFPEYRKTWQSWPVKCPWEVWLAMKEGKPFEFFLDDDPFSKKKA